MSYMTSMTSYFSLQFSKTFRSIPTYVITDLINVTDGQATCGITALCVASRGKNYTIANRVWRTRSNRRWENAKTRQRQELLWRIKQKKWHNYSYFLANYHITCHLLEHALRAAKTSADERQRTMSWLQCIVDLMQGRTITERTSFGH